MGMTNYASCRSSFCRMNPALDIVEVQGDFQSGIGFWIGPARLNFMRVISGTYRSRRLAAPPGLATRPTSDRLRETLFNMLAPRIQGATFADLYAGSGANGIEALSRGASMALFVESAPPALEAIRLNLKSLGIVSGYGLEPRSVSSFLRRLAQRERKLDITFLDPPYDEVEECAATLELLGGECTPLLTAESIVVAEHRRKQPLSERYGALERYRVREQSDAALSFFRLEAERTTNDS
jgi:16S rRNA (guanine966-N2)-methyltransferase